jgi:hypothetical protein
LWHLCNAAAQLGTRRKALLVGARRKVLLANPEMVCPGIFRDGKLLPARSLFVAPAGDGRSVIV